MLLLYLIYLIGLSEINETIRKKILNVMISFTTMSIDAIVRVIVIIMNTNVYFNWPQPFTIVSQYPSTAVIWPKYCRYGVKHYVINQSINQYPSVINLISSCLEFAVLDCIIRNNSVNLTEITDYSEGVIVFTIFIMWPNNMAVS